MKTQKDINLIAKERVEFRKRLIAKTMIFVMLLVCAFIVGSFTISKILYKNLTTKNDELLSKISIFKDTETLSTSITSLEKELATVEKLHKEIANDKIQISGILEKVIPIIPPNVAITKFGIIKGNTINISFAVKDYTEAVKLYETLKKSKMFSNLDNFNVPLKSGATEISFNLKLITKK